MAKDGSKAAGFLPRVQDVPGDALAGVVNAVVSVPSGMATAAMAGVNPIYGLYATTVAPTVGGLFASSQLMQIATTGASALAAGQAIATFPDEDRGAALFLLVALSGLFLMAFGLLGAGKLIRYVSYPVMTAFLSGVAAALVMDQAAQFAGYTSEASTTLGSFVDLVLHPGEFSWNAVLIGGVALVIMILLGRTRLENTAPLVALLIPSFLAFWWEPGEVEIVNDVSEIPSGLPPFELPDLSLITPGLALAAFALAVVIALQGAGVSQGTRNPDGSEPSSSRDMLAQGLGNVAASLVNGMPAGASISQSALNTQVGARSRFAMVFHGIAMLGVILIASNLVAQVPMTVLAAIMIVAGVQAIKIVDMRSIWQVGGSARWAMLVTFLATLLTSIPVAVGLGVMLTMVLFIVRAGHTIEVHELVTDEEGRFHVHDAPSALHSGQVTALDVYGPLYFAAARTLRERLPAPDSAENAAVVLRVRGNSQIGATFIDEIAGYAHELAEHGGRLYLCGMAPALAEKIRRANRLSLDDEVVLVPGEEILGASLREAIRQAEAWVRAAGGGGRESNPPDPDTGPLRF